MGNWRIWVCVATLVGAFIVVTSESEAALFCDGKRVTVNLAAGDRPTAGRDVIWGTNRRDVIHARGGNDIICARGGPDTVHGGPGADRILGGNGRDGMLGGQGRDFCYGGNGSDAGRCETLRRARRCAASYPTICVPPRPPDLDCGDIPYYRNFRVREPDPHGFDNSDPDLIGCET